MKKILLSVTFFAITPIILALSLIYLSYFSYVNKDKSNAFANVNKKIAFAAIPTTENVLKDQILSQDKRIENLKLFFNEYNSPLEPYAENIVNVSEKYGLDYRLLPAIAMQESNLCKKAPKDSYNCWGFGIYGKKVTKFSNYADAIEEISETLATEYKGNGLITPEEIMGKYAPSNNGAWASSVNFFINQL